jgi:hypothetical protein
MNPLTWQREHQMALLIGTVLGIVAGLFVGYVHHDIRFATLQQWFSGWSSVRWAVFGALFGASLIYIQRLLRT